MTQLLIIAYLIVLLISLLSKTPVLKSPWLFLLRAFFPNWKFFHAVGPVPHLYARAGFLNENQQIVWSDWIWIYPRRERHWGHLFHNADTNLGLAQQNLVDHFWADIDDLKVGQDPQQLVTYQLVQRLIQKALNANYLLRTHEQFELRMELSSRTQMTKSDVMLTSPICAC